MKYYAQSEKTKHFVDEVNGVYYWDKCPRKAFYYSEILDLRRKFPGMTINAIPVS